jgi:hypothetical protein
MRGFGFFVAMVRERWQGVVGSGVRSGGVRAGWARDVAHVPLGLLTILGSSLRHLA